jgi:putative transposase
VSRPPRYSYAQAVHHVTLRCNNREFLFSPPSLGLFTHILQEARDRFPLRLYNYCLMTNHVHLLFKVGKDETLAKAMHWISSCFSRRFNRMTGRHGHLWEGRYRSTIIEESTYFLRCMTYLDLNPVHAGIVAECGQYQWSGFGAVFGEDTARVELHPLYLALGDSRASRQLAYAELLADASQRKPVPLAREYFVGSGDFVARMARRFGLATPRTRTRQHDVGVGLVALGPHHGRRIP